MESRLVLEAAGISAEAISRDGWWLLVVGRDDLAISAAELEAYRQENPDPSPRSNAVVADYGSAGLAVLVYSGTLMLIALLDAKSAFGLQWQTSGQMQAGEVMAGEWWRTVTALTLHADSGHIAANLLFGALFGFLAGQVLGGGVAWLVIVAAGALGNLLNAVVQAPTHTSIGASTAVFAALGVIVAHALRPRAPPQESLLKRWSPLVGGVLLLAYLGVGGENTDVIAHVTGFMAGLLVGWLGCRLPSHWLAGRKVQQAAGFATMALIILSWLVALKAG